MSAVLQPQIDCTSAHEFLEALSPLGPHFGQAEVSAPWLFRGQGGPYPLIPSLFRKPGKLQDFTTRDTENFEELLLAERDILIQFFEIADKRGLILPDDSQELRSILEIFKSERGDSFTKEESVDWQPSQMALSLTALAQHYGLPTRLLDWTRQAWIAAFFAAESASQPNEPGKQPRQVVVWAFFFPKLGKHDPITVRHDDAPLRVVTAPSASNPNLRAQQGVFTRIGTSSSKAYREEFGIAYPSLEEFLEWHVKKWPKSNEGLLDDCKLQKFTLPASQADQLLYLLAKLDITPSAVYPGYRTIVDDLRMQNRWTSGGQI